MTDNQYMALQFIAAHPGCLAVEIGRHLRVEGSSRAASARGAGVVRALIQARLVTRKAIRYELHGYTVTPLGLLSL